MALFVQTASSVMKRTVCYLFLPLFHFSQIKSSRRVFAFIPQRKAHVIKLQHLQQ